MTKTQRVKVGNPKSQKKRRQNTVKTSKTNSFIKKFCVFALKFSLILFLFISMITVCAVVYYLDDLPDISNLEGTTKKPNVTIYAQDNTIIGNYGDIQGEFLTYSQLPISAIYALLATEDQRFFDHNGVDILGVIRAAYHNYKAGRIVEGGSTITQQLAKILFLSPEKTFKRKIQEVLLAWKIEQQFSKEQILSIYLNKVFLGQGNFGIDAAAHYYFGKSGKDLNLYESAALIGMLKAPSKYSVTSNHIGTIQRARQVLFNMENRGFIKPKDIQFAVPPVLLKKGLTRGVLKNPYFTDYIMEEVVHMLGTIDRDLDIYTTLDLNKQTALESAIVKNMQKLNKSYI